MSTRVRAASGNSVLNEIQSRWLDRNRETVLVLVLTVLAFAVRVHRIDFNSLSEDETAKWAAVQEYRQGHFAGVNSEHPMLPKMLAWGSLSIGNSWDRIAATHHWPSMRAEGWLRLPNVIFGALTAAILYLLCRRMMGIPGSLAAGFFWAVSPLPIALNRLTKEETPLAFFTLLACYFYCRAQQANGAPSARRWYDLSAISFGFSLASQYIVHLLGLNALAWLFAGKLGLTHNPSRFSYKRFFLVLLLTFILVNPVILFPSNMHAILQWLHHDGVKHTGYNFDGKLYMNFPSRLFAGVPWFYYLWLLLIKTPVPILIAVVIGGTLLLRHRRNLAFCFFIALGVVQLAGLSVSGAKWIRYSLPMLPFLYLAGGYAVQQLSMVLKERAASRALVTIGVIVLVGWPILQLQAWAPFYSLYLNSIGGGRRNITRYFAPDEISEIDTREVAQEVCAFATRAAKLATARPMSMAYYVQRCGRMDIDVVPLYDPHYVPRDGDLIVLEPSRRFFETQRFFDALGSSGMPHNEIRVAGVLASAVYRFDGSTAAARSLVEDSTVSQLGAAPVRFEPDAQQLYSSNTSGGVFWRIRRRHTQ
jgi:Dolichyl-phosphate-mannose-protein mannosyltransferase